jgi:hypothetical protein
MAWRPMVTLDGRTWAGNALVFATKQEAEDSAKELMDRWHSVVGVRADECTGAVNYEFVCGKNVRLPDTTSDGRNEGTST